MRRTLGKTGLVLLVFWASQIGCNKPAVREKPLPDPLLTSKKPVEGKAQFADWGDRAEELPPAPPLPPLPRVATAEASVVQLLGPRTPQP